jgi:hypothetical protein
MENISQFMSNLDELLAWLMWFVFAIAGGVLLWKALKEIPNRKEIFNFFEHERRKPPVLEDSEEDIDFSRDVPPPESQRSQERPKEFYLGALHPHNKN